MYLSAKCQCKGSHMFIRGHVCSFKCVGVCFCKCGRIWKGVVCERDVCMCDGVYPFGQALGMFNTVWKLLRQSVAVAVTQETVISALLTCLHQQHLPAVNHWLMAGLLPGGHRTENWVIKFLVSNRYIAIYTQQVLPETKYIHYC